MKTKEWNWSTVLAILSFLFGVTAAFSSLSFVAVAVVASVLTALTSLMATFVNNYETWLNTPAIKGDTHVLSRKEQVQLQQKIGGNVRLPNLFEWILGRRQPIPDRKASKSTDNS
jgi:uncharacterized membrane protein YfhO